MGLQFTRQQWIILALLGLAVIVVYGLGVWVLSTLNSSPQMIAAATLTRTPLPTYTLTATPTNTRTPTLTPTSIPPTPTFLPSPTSTVTLIPTITRTPTRRAPTPTATAKPFAYKFKAVNQGCEHSGQTFIQGKVYDKSGELLNGLIVVLSGAGPDGAIADKRQTGDDGDGAFSFIVDANGPVPGQKRWIWMMTGSQRISDVVQFSFNNYNEKNPASCLRGWVDFVQQ